MMLSLIKRLIISALTTSIMRVEYIFLSLMIFDDQNTRFIVKSSCSLALVFINCRITLLWLTVSTFLILTSRARTTYVRRCTIAESTIFFIHFSLFCSSIFAFLNLICTRMLSLESRRISIISSAFVWIVFIIFFEFIFLILTTFSTLIILIVSFFIKRFSFKIFSTFHYWDMTSARFSVDFLTVFA